jgi:predicted NACHT family NTPase
MRVAEAIDSFTQQYQGNRFVITSRPRGYEGEARQRLSAQYPDWMIQDFDDADMENIHQHLVRSGSKIVLAIVLKRLRRLVARPVTFCAQ